MAVKWDETNKGSGATIGADGVTFKVSKLAGSAVVTNVSKNSGKHYCEIEITGGQKSVFVGICNTLFDVAGECTQVNSWLYYGFGGLYNGSSTSYGVGYGPGDTIGIAMDLDNNKLGFYKNGVYQGDACSLKKDSYRICVGFASSYSYTTGIARFKAVDMKYPIPKGFKAIDEDVVRFLLNDKNNFFSIQSKFYDSGLDDYVSCDKNYLDNGFSDIDDLVKDITGYELIAKQSNIDEENIFELALNENISSINSNAKFILFDNVKYYTITENVLVEIDNTSSVTNMINSHGLSQIESSILSNITKFKLLIHNESTIPILDIVFKASFKPIDKFGGQVEVLRYKEN